MSANEPPILMAIFAAFGILFCIGISLALILWLCHKVHSFYSMIKAIYYHGIYVCDRTAIIEDKQGKILAELNYIRCQVNHTDDAVGKVVDLLEEDEEEGDPEYDDREYDDE